MQKSNLSFVKIEKQVYCVVSFLLLIYLCLRAYFVPLIHDEATTFTAYIRLFEFIPGHAYWDANNHILNSFLAGLAYKFFGSHPFILRLPNVLAFVVFAFASFKIGQHMKLHYCRWAFWLALLFATFVIEFFALTRGYGLAMAFMLLSIMFFFNYQRYGKFKFLLALLASLNLMVLSNLSFYYVNIFILSWIALLIFNFLRKHTFKAGLQLIVFIVLGILPALLAVKYGLELRERDLLYYGSLGGFWSLTIRRLHIYLFYNNIFISKLVVVALGIAGMLVAFFFAVKSYKGFLRQHEYVFPALLMGCLATIIFQAEIMQVNYPEDRAGVYLYLLWVGTLFFMLDKLNTAKPSKWVKISSCLALFFPVSFVLHSNVIYSQLWSYEHISPKIYKIANTPKDNFTPTVSGYFLRKGIWSYYNKRSKKLPTQSLSIVGYPLPYTHYILLRAEEYPFFKYHHLYTQVYYDKYSGQRLFERTQPVKLKRIQKKSGSHPIPTNKTYFDLLRKDSLPLYDLAIDVELQLQFDGALFEGTVTAQRWVADTVYSFDNYGIANDNRKFKNGKLHIKVRLFVTAMEKWQPNRLVLFIYNKEKEQKYRVLSYSLKLYALE